MTADPSLAAPSRAEISPDAGVAPLLRTEDLTIRFGGLTALNHVNFAVERGEIRAIIGPNGAGKSTFFNCLTGVLRPTSGSIVLAGEDITGLPPNKISQKGIARSYQITNILPNATALENVRIAAQSRRHGWSMFTHHRSYRDIIEKAEAALDAVGLFAKAEELAANLSHGEQRTLEIAIALATEPQLLCLDEPTAGMSAAETHDTMQLVRRIAENLTILIVEHDMQVVMELADRITVFHYGEILAEGPPAGDSAKSARARGLSEDMTGGRKSLLVKRHKFVLAGLDPAIRAFRRPEQRRGCADQVRARRLHIVWCTAQSGVGRRRSFPGQPCVCAGMTARCPCWISL